MIRLQAQFTGKMALQARFPGKMALTRCPITTYDYSRKIPELVDVGVDSSRYHCIMGDIQHTTRETHNGHAHHHRHVDSHPSATRHDRHGRRQATPVVVG